MLRSEVVVPGVEVRRLVYLRRGGELVEAAGRKVQIRRQVDAHDRREHAVDQSTEHRAGERVGQVADDDVFVEQRDKHRGDLIADEAELEQEKLHLIAICLPLAQIERLHHAELGIFTQVQHGERVAVGRDDAGDDEKHRPQEDENALDDGEQDDLSGKGKRVKKALIRHFLTAQDAEAVAVIPRVQNERDEADEDAHKAEREHCEAAGRVDHIAHARVDHIEHKGDEKIEKRHPEGIDLTGAQQ